MCREVKFWDQEDNDLVANVNVHKLWEGKHPFPQVNVPLADNVIRQNEHDEFNVLHTREKEIVHIHISAKVTVSPNAVLPDTNDLLFAFLQVSDRAGALKVVPNAVDSPDPSGCQVLRPF